MNTDQLVNQKVCLPAQLPLLHSSRSNLPVHLTLMNKTQKVELLHLGVSNSPSQRKESTVFLQRTISSDL